MTNMGSIRFSSCSIRLQVLFTVLFARVAGYSLEVESSNIQHPNSREAPNFKLQNRPGDYWMLELEVSLELGAWNLELLQSFPSAW
jgi:hypothetical protein